MGPESSSHRDGRRRQWHQAPWGARLPASFLDGTSDPVVLMERYAQATGGGAPTQHYWSALNNYLSPTATSGFQLAPDAAGRGRTRNGRARRRDALPSVAGGAALAGRRSRLD